MCEVCHISDGDVGYAWYWEHRKAGIPACAEALAARRSNVHMPRIHGNWSHDVGGWLIPADAICRVCGITATDSIGKKWYQRHYSHNTEPCDASRLSSNRYGRRRNARNRKKQLYGEGADERPWWTVVDPNALCHMCGITKDDLATRPSAKFYQRHRLRGTVACRYSMSSSNEARRLRSL